MAKTRRIEQCGVAAAVYGEYHKKVVEGQFKEMSRKMFDMFEKEKVIPLDVKTYIAKSYFFDDSLQLGVKSNVIYVGSDWGYRKRRAKQVIREFVLKTKRKFISKFIDEDYDY